MSTVYSPPAAHPPAYRPCPSCGREWGAGVACQFCDQVDGLPAGVRLSSPGRRLGAHLLDLLLMVVTLFIGWLVWSLIVWGRGQTPGKQIMNMRTVTLGRGRTASWGRMALREIVAKGVIGVLAWFTLGIVYFWLVWDKSKQELWDKVVGTVVVNDPHDQLALLAGAQHLPPPAYAAPQPVAPPGAPEASSYTPPVPPQS